MNTLMKNKLIRLCMKMEPFFLSEKLYLKTLFYLKMGYRLNLNTPKTYSEKIQWLKLYNRKREYTSMVDKYLAKEYVGKTIGAKYIIPTYGVWDKVEDIAWDSLPNQFVIKTTHAGGGLGVVICRDKNNFDVHDAMVKLNNSFSLDIYKLYKEWPYKDVKKRVIAEMYLEESGFSSPRDYKVMCFDGKVKLIEYHEGRFSKKHTQDFYDIDWKKTSITQGSYGEVSPYMAERPQCLNEMIELSEKLAEGIPHLRVDWYIINNRLYFGELTFFDGSGLEPWDKYEDELLMGSWITLPEKTMGTTISKGFGNEGIDMLY